VDYPIVLAGFFVDGLCKYFVVGVICDDFEGVGMGGDESELILFVDVCGVGEDDVKGIAAHLLVVGN
jgi:hypothetical protein